MRRPARPPAAPRPPGAFKHLTPGARYAVLQAFEDADGLVHAVGEQWTYLGYNFVPYEDGLSLFVAVDGQGQRQIRLRWREDAQGPVVDTLDSHIGPAD
jgi:hypothetical protein